MNSKKPRKGDFTAEELFKAVQLAGAVLPIIPVVKKADELSKKDEDDANADDLGFEETDDMGMIDVGKDDIIGEGLHRPNSLLEVLV